MRGVQRERAESRQRGEEALEERFRRMAFRMLRALLVALSVFLAFLLASQGPAATFDSIGGVFLVVWLGLVILALFRLRAGRVGQAVWLAIIGAMLILSTETLERGVMRPAEPFLFAYSLPIVFAALLVGRNALIAVVLLIVAIVTFTYLGETRGIEWIGTDRGDDGGTVVVVFGLVMALLAVVLERFRLEIREAQSTLIRREREQANLVTSLEREIEDRKAVERQRVELLDREREARRQAEELVAENERLLREIRGLNEQLERRVADRTRELSEALGELETFTNSAAHDLRTPLRGIDGFCQVLLDEYGDRLDEPALQYVARIRAGAKRLGDLIDDLLLLSRITRRDLRLERLDLAALARQVVSRLRQDNPGRQVSVEIYPEMSAVADVRLVYAVLENLIGNAWKFSDTSPEPRIEVGMTEQEGELVYFVKDNGIGFDLSYADKLFSPFQRLHASERYEGSGIGLAIVDRAVRKLGGRVWAQSRPGDGAVFYFTLGKQPHSSSDGRDE